MIRRPPRSTLFPYTRSSDLHLTRGRAMMGVGPGALPTDATMIGIDPLEQRAALEEDFEVLIDRKSTRLNSSHSQISYAVFCLKKKKTATIPLQHQPNNNNAR